MVRFYVNMIRNKRIVIADVPEKWRKDVEKALDDK